MDTDLRVEARVGRQGTSVEQNATGKGGVVSREGGSGGAIANL